MMRTSPVNTRQQPNFNRGGVSNYFRQPQRRSTNLSPISGSRSPPMPNHISNHHYILNNNNNINNNMNNNNNNTGGGPHHDRFLTIRLVCPCTNTVVCTRLNKVVPTIAKGQSGAAACEEFMYTQICPLGEMCPKVHVAQEHTWSYITQDINKSTGLYEPGFAVQCYDQRMTNYYTIPSEFVLPTRGSNEYVKMHNEHGDNFKAKFKLCEAMTMRGQCDLGATCEDIHTIFENFSAVESTTTHIAEPEMIMQYPRLRSDITVRVFEQNSNETFVDFPGDQVLVTLGARQYMAAYDAEKIIPKKKMQHCAHFRTKHLCRMGENCRFLHVITGLSTSPGNSLIVGGGISPNSISRGDSPTSDININVRNRHGAQWVSGGQVAVMVAQKYGVSGNESGAPMNMTQGGMGDSLYSTSSMNDNNNNNNNNNNTNTNTNASLTSREDVQGLNEATLGSSRVMYSASQTANSSISAIPQTTTTTVLESSGKMRMISPLRRNNPYAMHPGEEGAPPQRGGMSP